MKSRIFKRLLIGFLSIITVFVLLMITPRVWSALHPDQPPVGYHFLAPTYIAVGVGLEQTINRRPAVPSDIQEIKNIE